MFNSGISTVSTLKKLKKENIKLKSKIIVDGGVRKGSDIIKYICLGADLIGIGRPAIYGLTIQGGVGVYKIFTTLENELKTAMINGGFRSIKDMNFSRIEY